MELPRVKNGYYTLYHKDGSVIRLVVGADLKYYYRKGFGPEMPKSIEPEATSAEEDGEGTERKTKKSNKTKE